jgi:hypothetical protein
LVAEAAQGRRGLDSAISIKKIQAQCFRAEAEYPRITKCRSVRADGSLLAPKGSPSKNPIVLDLNINDALTTLTEGWLPNPGKKCEQPPGTNTMKTLFDILRKDRAGTFHWVEMVSDINTAEARLRQLSAESRDEFVVFRTIDLRVVAMCTENGTYRRLRSTSERFSHKGLRREDAFIG